MSASRVLVDAASTLTDDDLRGRVGSVPSEVEALVDDYVSAARAAATHALDPAPFVLLSVSSVEMQDLYTNKMVPAGAPARKHYEQIQRLAPHRKCPYCGHGTVRTLDHVMPKAAFPALSVAPLNLVPACSDCNHAKGSRIETDPDLEPIHPYFDDIAERWLFAEVEEECIVRFFVTAPSGWSKRLSRRVQAHFDRYKLAFMYASQAGGEVQSVSHYLRANMATLGADAIRLHLAKQAESRARVHVNSWQHALYDALSASDWFCDGGFIASVRAAAS